MVNSQLQHQLQPISILRSGPLERSTIYHQPVPLPANQVQNLNYQYQFRRIPTIANNRIPLAQIQNLPLTQTNVMNNSVNLNNLTFNELIDIANNVPKSAAINSNQNSLANNTLTNGISTNRAINVVTNEEANVVSNSGAAAAANSENNGEASTGKKRGVPKGTKRGPYNKKTKTK